MNWLHSLWQMRLSDHSLSALFYLRCLLLLLGLFVGYLCVRAHAKNKGFIGSWTRKEPLVRAVHGMAMKALMLILGAIIGYGIRDHQLASRTVTYHNVLIKQRVAERDFWIMPQWMEAQHVQICSESVVDWKEAEVLDWWKFEQQQGCKRVISYHKKPHGELNAAYALSLR